MLRVRISQCVVHFSSDEFVPSFSLLALAPACISQVYARANLLVETFKNAIFQIVCVCFPRLPSAMKMSNTEQAAKMCDISLIFI